MANAAAYHHLYKTAEWQRLRAGQLRLHPLCRMCLALQSMVPATVVDHVRPHRGDLALFRDPTNLQSLCKLCHNAHKQAQEHQADGLLRGAGHDGAPLDAAHPWHRAPTPALCAPATSTPGGEQILPGTGLRTGPFPSFAAPRNSEGGVD